MTSSPAVNGGASLPQQGTQSLRFGSVPRPSLPAWAGFVPRPGASCGTATRAPIRKRVIVTRFLDVTLTQAVEPRGSVPAPLRSHLVGRRPSTGLAEHRMGGGPSPLAWETAEPVVTSTSGHIVSVWVPGRPPAVVRGGGVGRPP